MWQQCSQRSPNPEDLLQAGEFACPLVPRAVSQLTALAYVQLLAALFHRSSNNTNGSQHI